MPGSPSSPTTNWKRASCWAAMARGWRRRKPPPLLTRAAADSGKATWFWQTRAWSDGKLHDRAHIFQFEVDTEKHPVRAFGAAVDFDRSLKADYGQWKIGQHFEEDIDMATGDEIMTFLKTLRQDLTVFGTHSLHETVENFAKNQRTTRNQLDDLEKKVADLTTKVHALSQPSHR